MDEVLKHLRSELAGRYEVEQELGHGGMAVVYLAKDLKHDRKVAIKVLRSDLGVGGGDRFLREIRTVAQLHHPHILALHDSGTAGDHLFYVMPYVEGETVRQRLERTGPLSVDEAVRLAREVADALEYAHARGVVHRDIKPENIFIAAGHALVADFGIAKAADAAGLTTTLTDVGLAIGTPAYMSPEQATADPKVDGRSDQYALGCVLYEMLAGVPPFSGPTSQSIMARHTSDAVPPLSTIRAIPPALESTIVKALAKMPADRWPSAKVFAETLDQSMPPRVTGELSAPANNWSRRVIRIGAVAAAAVAIVLVWRFGNPIGGRLVAEAADASASVAVIPFAYSGDSAYRFFAASIREDVIMGLVRVRELAVPEIDGRWSNNPIDDPREAGRAYGVRTVLTASVTVVGNILRVSTKLVNVSDGLIRWQHRFESEVTSPEDQFATQDSIVLKIVDVLVPQLSPERRKLAARGVGTRNPEALRLLANARAIASVDTREAGRRRVALLREAVKLDSNYADAWAELAGAVDDVGRLDGTPAIDAAPEVRRLAEKAIALDSSNALAYELSGRFYWFYDWNWEGAERAMRRAVDIAPGSSSAITQYCYLLHFMNQQDSALVFARRFVAMDSTSAEAWDNLAVRYLHVGKTDSALVAGDRARRLEPNASTEVLADAYLLLGRASDAARIVQASMAPGAAANNPFALGLMSLYFARLGDLKQARELYDRLKSVARTQYVSPGFMSIPSLYVGDREGAIRALEEAVRVRDRALPVMLSGVYWHLKDDPRVEAVRQKVYQDRTPPRDLFAPDSTR